MPRVIALVGGGTMGPVVPLLALQKKLSALHPADKFVWVGTPDGPEKRIIENSDLAFVSLRAAKLPRYLTWKLLTWPFDYYKAKQQAGIFLDDWHPHIIIGAGGFTQVPVMRLAAERGIPCVIHQLDYDPLLSNKLVAKYCRLITTTFVYHKKLLTVPLDKYRNRQADEKRIATPNRFVGLRWPEKIMAAAHFGLDARRPVVLFTGGGTGSLALNQVVENNLDKWLSKIQIIHLTGKGRGLAELERPGYVKREFLDEQDLLNAYAAADVVVSRAGMGAITDLATLSKTSILVPIKNSSQERNAQHLPLGAVEVKEGPGLFDDIYKQVCHLLKHPDESRRLADELHRSVKTDDGTEWAELIQKFLPEDED
ncbi:MAG TPA: glycosyltransferase [bacterium]|nr:MAG: UDP-N-acetylglucosamine--N-acetylmuramyl-(pentapeptide) pyrophosphoryl-undecaprenol N-acetylglucosamine transferase [Parcubacteria group bacterium ADurb.Bin192]HPN15051.1 glycosyltransferase [bacterium]